jgi:DNA polymerase I-like protein with 3'-5' exonuclease and polymerase domains/uracil-DNA glycosylase
MSLVRTRKKKHEFRDLDDTPIFAKAIPKHDRDIISYVHGTEDLDGKLVTRFNPAIPLGDKRLIPGPNSPICEKCRLATKGAENPYMDYSGPTDPLITIITDSVSFKEDAVGELTAGGPSGFLKNIITDMAKTTGIDPSRIRWAPITRCAPRTSQANFKTHGDWCKSHLVQDLAEHPPQLIVPIGTAALGLLNHKSNAQDWSGRLLTYRGWPDDWLTDPAFVLPRVHPANPESRLIGHPIFGKPPTHRIPLMPLQTPRLVFASRNPQLIQRWKNQLKTILQTAKNGVAPLNYDRPWFKLSEDIEEIKQALMEIARIRPITCYDTETTGLRPWGEGQSIVFQMFRWEDEHGNPRSIGFPWDYAESPLKAHINELAPYVLEALYKSRLVGHNLAFDMLFACANIPGADINKLASACEFDTWHMAYTHRQETGSLGLDMIAYQWVPDFAGYEEDMTLLIKLHKEKLDPAEGLGGHYANCPKDRWDTDFKTYVMGDVEVAYVARRKLQEKLDNSITYEIPIAHPTDRGRFRRITPPNRAWVYKNIMSPANRLLIKMMGRGMHVDLDELSLQEDIFPKKIKETRELLKKVNPKVIQWCEQNEATQSTDDKKWEFDPEDKSQLKTVLFDLMGLPIQRLTPAGRKIYGEEPGDLVGVSREELLKYAALDKYTLNKLSVDFEQVRPLQEYRKVFKQYTTYIRPMRNFFFKGIDKKQRDGDMHLSRDGNVHATFLLTGTRAGRLSCRNPNLQQLVRDGLIKRIYVSRFGNRGCLYQGDLSQIELRLIAAACGDKSMVKAYWDDVDLHSLTHSLIFKRKYEECTKDYMQWLQSKGRDKEAKILETQRKIAKTVNFLTGYGGGPMGLQTSLAQQGVYLSLDECIKILENFFDSYPSLRTYLSQYKRFIMDNGVAVSILGRVRVFQEVFSDDKEAINKALRAGCNHLIQSTASDMMLVLLGVIENLMRHANLESSLISTVHDSLLIDCVKTELPQIHEIVDSVLSNIPEVMKLVFGDDYDTSWCIVPFAGDSEVGKNYLDMKKISGKNIDWDSLFRDDKK